jgi:urease accessory protein
VVADGLLADRELESFFGDYLQEYGKPDAAFCRAAHRLARISGEEFAIEWRNLNQLVSARKLPRESRGASLALGRRFLALAADLLPSRPVAPETESHHVTAFGLVTALAGVEESSAVLAWLHQSVTALVSAVQRLAPLGQTRATGILWSLKPRLAEIAHTSSPAEADCFAPVPEIASMRHARLSTRLFIS